MEHARGKRIGSIAPSRARSIARSIARPVALMAGLALGVGGCYHYTSTTFDHVAPKTHVRAHLTSEKTLELEPELGALRTQLTGEVLERRSDPHAVLLAVPRLDAGTPLGSNARLREWFWIEESAVIRVDVRSLDRRRTGLMAGAAGAAVGYLLARAIRGSVETPEPNGGGNGTP
ncbi:MAG: hypothetical protein EA350_17350 [Gemmatimonadales bacterium]|nr:MAG: hypothetical protein EA350_17350 [Gemmatimonadales bacterium]